MGYFKKTHLIGKMLYSVMVYASTHTYIMYSQGHGLGHYNYIDLSTEEIFILLKYLIDSLNLSHLMCSLAECDIQ